MIRNTINSGIGFIKRNPTILYSLVLIVAVTSIIFFNSYYSLRKFEVGTDKLLQSKANLGGIVFKSLSPEFIDDKDYLESKMREVKEQDSAVREIAILKKDIESEKFLVTASTSEDIDFGGDQGLYAILWTYESPRATISHDDNGRFWNVIDIIRDKDGKKIGIILFQLSLSEHDKFSQAIINRVYLVTVGSLLIVLLIIVNHARLFKYEMRASKLEEIDKMKDDFISMASHELKSPLTAIKGYAELLSDNVKESSLEKKKEYLRYINNISLSATRLRDLVEDILEVSKLEQNRLPIELEEVNLTEIISGLVDEMRISADEKKLEILNNVGNISKVIADRDRSKQILVNLISNAIKYTPFGKIEIKSKEDDKFVYMTVADTGLGMSAENMKNLFSKFYRIKNEKTAMISGTGLGLWISREIALKMEGDLTVESIEGIGSHFTLKLKKVKNKK